MEHCSVYGAGSSVWPAGRGLATVAQIPGRCSLSPRWQRGQQDRAKSGGRTARPSPACNYRRSYESRFMLVPRRFSEIKAGSAEPTAIAAVNCDNISHDL